MANHRYRIAVEPLDGGSPLVFEASTHDDLLAIVERIRASGDFEGDRAPAFAVGLKLFSESLLAHKALPHFAALAPHFGEFMRALKGGRPRP